jgi:hypothetical protein
VLDGYLVYTFIRSLTNMNTCKTVALSIQRSVSFWISTMRPLLTHIYSLEPCEMSIFALQCDWLSTSVEVTAAVWDFSLCAVRRQLSSRQADTAASPTVDLFGKVTEQYVVIYSVPTVASSVLKRPPYLHRRVVKTSNVFWSC